MIRDDPLTFLGQEEWLSLMQGNPSSNKMEKEHFTQNCPLASTDVHTSHIYTGVFFFFKWIFKEQIGHKLTSFKSIVVESVLQITGIEHNSQKINNRWHSLIGYMSPAKEGDRISCKIHAWILACLGCVFICFNFMLEHSTEQTEQVPTGMKKKAIFIARFYLMHIVKLWIRILFMKTNHFLQWVLGMTQKNIFIDCTQMLLTKSAVE